MRFSFSPYRNSTSTKSQCAESAGNNKMSVRDSYWEQFDTSETV